MNKYASRPVDDVVEVIAVTCRAPRMHMRDARTHAPNTRLIVQRATTSAPIVANAEKVVGHLLNSSLRRRVSSGSRRGAVVHQGRTERGRGCTRRPWLSSAKQGSRGVVDDDAVASESSAPPIGGNSTNGRPARPRQFSPSPSRTECVVVARRMARRATVVCRACFSPISDASACRLQRVGGEVAMLVASPQLPAGSEALSRCVTCDTTVASDCHGTGFILHMLPRAPSARLTRMSA